MLKKLLLTCVFALGLAAVGWIALGYLGSNPLGVAVALLIGACYLTGSVELWRYRKATATLQRALDALREPPAALGDWLAQLHPSLRHAVRLRVEGERSALPAPAMTPYLVGLLVLLGMLGTLLGMMATLRGTGTALASAAELAAIRGSLAAPVNGLAFAFGTSIAGVASSAMLGLLAALLRRERLQVVQTLDAACATHLHPHSQAHRREESFRLQQQQSAALPALLDRLQAMAATLEQHSMEARTREQAEREAFHRHTEASYARLAQSVEQTLASSLAESARVVGNVLQPALASTLDGLARESAALQASTREAVQRQLDGLSAGFDASTQQVGRLCGEMLAQQQQTGEAQAQQLGEALVRFSEHFEQRASALLDGVATRLDGLAAGFDASAQQVASLGHGLLNQHQQANEAHAQQLGEALAQVTDAFAQRADHLLDGVATHLDASAQQHAATWQAALTQQAAAHTELAERQQQALTAATADFAAQSTALIGSVDRSHAALHAEWQSSDEARLAGFAQRLDALSAELARQWQVAGDATASRQQAICDALALTADAIAAQSREHAGQTLAEIGRLVEAAAEAPRVAAEVVGELRQKLSDSMLRDTAMLEERNRLLTTLQTLLDAVNHASTEQRTAVDALVNTSSDLLERLGGRFAAQIETQAGTLDAAAAQLTASAVEVASLGEAFGAGVAQFGQTGDALMQRLQQLASALDASHARSDEQLAYYVAQAREVVELSVLSQQQILAGLQSPAKANGKATRA